MPKPPVPTPMAEAAFESAIRSFNGTQGHLTRALSRAETIWTNHKPGQSEPVGSEATIDYITDVVTQLQASLAKLEARMDIFHDSSLSPEQQEKV